LLGDQAPHELEPFFLVGLDPFVPQHFADLDSVESVPRVCPDESFVGAVVVALGSFIYEHIAMVRVALPAAALDVFAIAILIAMIRQIAVGLQIDYDKPIAVIQKQLEDLRVLRIRYIQGIFLAATLAWTPVVRKNSVSSKSLPCNIVTSIWSSSSPARWKSIDSKCVRAAWSFDEAQPSRIRIEVFLPA
jgi:hypothetical protein